VQALLLCVGAFGALVFSWAAGLWSLSGARMLIGIGSAGGLMAGFKAVTIWVPEQRRALANACIMAVGGLGILTATVPAEWATANFGWRAMFVGLMAITLAVAVFLYLVVPERPKAPDAATQSGSTDAGVLTPSRPSTPTACSGALRPSWRSPLAATSASRRCGPVRG
jgi:MFS family permease